MKKTGLAALLLVACHPVFSQERFLYPTIPKVGKAISDFIPRGWKSLGPVSIDFNNDKFQDVAFVVEKIDPVVIEGNSCENAEPYHPKQLIILFGRPDNTFQLSGVATRLFGNCNWGVQGMDPFTELSLRRNTLGIAFLTGGSARNVITYYARYQDNDWYVIGAGSLQYWVGHMETGESTVDINLLTGRKESYQTDSSGKRSGYVSSNIGKRRIRLVDLDDKSPIPLADE